jgi:hypothetical protein
MAVWLKKVASTAEDFIFAVKDMCCKLVNSPGDRAGLRMAQPTVGLGDTA